MSPPSESNLVQEMSNPNKQTGVMSDVLIYQDEKGCVEPCREIQDKDKKSSNI